MSTRAELAQEICCNCGVEFWVPERFQRACKNDVKKSFFCPNGHMQHYVESDTDVLRRERDRLKQQIAQKDDEIRRQREHRMAAERSASAYKGQTTRLRNRARNGVCPCCNRSFANLRKHMAMQHPDFHAEAAE